MAYMTAVIYARYSSSSQREESIEGQLRECTAFAEKNGYTIIGKYMDRAISGKTDDRPQFQKMIQDSKKKLFDTVLVWKLDRFARNRYDSARYKNQLKKNGVRVISATETISNGAEGILLESMLEGMAEYYSADLAEKVVRGRTENALKCKWNGGTLPIGYIVDEEQHLQPNPLTASFVVDAYKLYDEGHTLTEVRDYLNAKGVKNTLGKPLTYNSVQHMLNNRRYIGEYIYRDIVTPGGIPALVPQDLFDRVQERLAKNKKAPARNKAEESYLLTTKLFCGHCGVYMCGESGKSRNGIVHRYYKCATVKKKRGDCKKKAVKKEWIENLVVDETMQMLMDDKAVNVIVSLLMDLQDQENTTLPMLEKELKDTEKGIKNIVSAVEKGMFSEALQKRMEELEAAKEDLTVRIEMEKLEKPKISAEEMTFWLHRFRKLDTTKEEHRQMLIDTFVNAVYVYDDKLLLTFNFKDGTKTISLNDVKAATEKNGSTISCSVAPSRGYKKDVAQETPDFIGGFAVFMAGILVVKNEDVKRMFWHTDRIRTTVQPNIQPQAHGKKNSMCFFVAHFQKGGPVRKESDLAGVKSVAKMLLMTKVNKTPFSPMVVQHPFTNTGIVGLPKDGGQELEILDITAERKNLARWQAMVEKQIDLASDPFQIYMMANPPYGLTFLEYAEPYLSQEDYTHILGSAWVMCEAPHNDPDLGINKLIAMFEKAAPAILMDEDEYATYQATTVMDFISYAIRYFITTQQYFEWR